VRRRIGAESIEARDKRLADCRFTDAVLGVRRSRFRSDDALAITPHRKLSSENRRPDPIEARQLLAGCCCL